MGKLFVAATAAAAIALATAAQAMPQPEPQAVIVPVKVEQVTAAAHLTYRDTEHHAVFETNLVAVGELPMLADGGCRMRDSAQEAAPGAPKSPTSTPHAPPKDDPAPVRPKGRWVSCS
ncbi:MAG: hypothetical protein JSR98_03500 [Proteobacteria bacterium]|nr:hypothetical protein [Pseudomonadota bacterium]